jgi:ATP-dependent Zn protease
LVELDGFEENNGVIVIAATNMVQKLDYALTRAGRFDRCIQVPLPSRTQRRDIMKMLLKNKGDRTIKIDELVSDMLGFNCADLSNIVNLAGIEAVKLKKEKISMKDLVEAKETVSLGRVRKTLTVIV